MSWLPAPLYLQRRFWEFVAEGVSPAAAGVAVGVSESTGRHWFADAGGVKPRLTEPDSAKPRRRLSFAEREEIAIGVAREESVRSIADRLGRDPSTISREIRRNAIQRRFGRPIRYRSQHQVGARPHRGRPQQVDYRAGLAQHRTDTRARRPKTGKLADNEPLRTEVQARLLKRDSPEQIANRLPLDFPNDPEMRVSHETIYESLYVQGRGGLRRDLHKQLRTGRAVRKPRRRVGQRGSAIRDMVNISERPAEAEDRAVPGHWEGDLIIGSTASGSAIGTLVERTTRFVMLLHLPEDHTAVAVQHAMVAKMAQLPAILRKTLTWDQGSEMANHAQIAEATELRIYFCDPHSPWQRGSNENTNGLLRQYFPKGTDLSVFDSGYLDYVAAQLNNRPRKTLQWRTPAEELDKLLSNPTNPPGVAMTA